MIVMIAMIAMITCLCLPAEILYGGRLASEVRGVCDGGGGCVCVCVLMCGEESGI